MKCKVLMQWINSVRVRLPRQFLSVINDVESSASGIYHDRRHATLIHEYTTSRVIPVMLDTCRLTSVVKIFDWSQCSSIASDIHHAAWDAAMDYYCQDDDALDQAALALHNVGLSSAIIETHPEQAANCLGQAYNHAVDAVWWATEEPERARLQDVFVGMIGEMFDGLLAAYVEEAA